MNNETAIAEDTGKVIEVNTPSNPMDVEPREFRKALNRRKKNRELLLEWIRESLVSPIDFMRVWSKKKKDWSKPFLTKAGAEKVCGMLGVQATYPNLEDYRARAASGEKIDMIVLQCNLVNSEGAVVATGAGGRLTQSEDYGDINKSMKMALKSAMIDATLRLGGLSEMFTQDEQSAAEIDEIRHSITEDQLKELVTLCEKGPLEPEGIAKFYSVKELKDLPGEYFFRARKAILKANEKAGEPGGES